MISHTHRCIFIHIPRTAGSSIEEWIVGRDWWNIDAKSKHISAHQAKQLYSEYWDEYFTFSFVRNPWDRMASCLHFSDYFGIDHVDGRFDFSGYERRFGFPVTLEVDHRFFDPETLIRPEVHTEGAVYGNLLDEDLDFVGRFESLTADIEKVRAALGIHRPFASDVAKGPPRPPVSELFDEASAEWVHQACARDVVAFGYDDDRRFR